MTLPATDSYAAGNNFGSLNRSPRTIIAQAMRAILLEVQRSATLIGRRPLPAHLVHSTLSSIEITLYGNCPELR
jgi:hypothetical protein